MTDKSPAVAAFEMEQANQREHRRDVELDSALKATFPASDPVSATSTSIPAGTVAAPHSPSLSGTPLVDEALSSARADSDEGYYDSAELRALRAEVVRLRESIGEIGSASLRVARAQASEVADEARDHIRRKPLAAVTIAALLGYVWGLTR